MDRGSLHSLEGTSSAKSPTTPPSILPPVGLMAGAGALPRMLLAALKRTGVPCVLLAFDGQTDPQTVEDFCSQGLCPTGPSLDGASPNGSSPQTPHYIWLGLGQVGRALSFLKSHGVKTLTMAGKFQRPSLSTLKVDWKGALWMAQMPKTGMLGDDRVLRFLAGKFEEEGFAIVSPQQIQETLLAPQGVLTHAAPSEEDWHAIQLGLEVLRALSPLDVGQAVVVQRRVVLGIEGVEGTDGLIQRCGALAKGRDVWGEVSHGQGGPLLIKTAKSTQDDRLDFPGLGPQTVIYAQQAGFRGIAFEAGRALLLEAGAMIQACNEAGMFLVGVGSFPPDVSAA